MNIITAVGKQAAELVAELAAERDVDEGVTRTIRDGDVKLDSVRAWIRSNSDTPIVHAVDGSLVEAVYKAYKKPTKRQKKEAEGAKAAGFSLRRIVGRIIDVRNLEPKPGEKEGDVVIMMTTALRNNSSGKVAIRTLNVSKGTLYGIAINGHLSLTDEQLEALMEAPAQPAAPTAQAQATSASSDGPAVPAAVPAEKKNVVIEMPSAPEPKAVAEKKVNLKSKGD